jgi:hypothetical protein
MPSKACGVADLNPLVQRIDYLERFRISGAVIYSFYVLHVVCTVYRYPYDFVFIQHKATVTFVVVVAL